MNMSKVVVSDSGLKMEVCNHIQRGEVLFSPLYKICFTECQLKALLENNNVEWSLYIKFKKNVEDELLYTLKVNSTKLQLSETFISDDSDWRQLGCYSTSTTTFDIEINIRTLTSPYLKVFFDDDSLTDFEMKGIDGSIRVHKIVLAAASEVFEKMITNDFKETNEARVEIPYSKDVLKDFKDYLYLNTINNDNLEHLLLLSHCYMINKLKQYCIYRLVYNMTSQNTLELIEFAVENKITELLVAIVNKIANKEVVLNNLYLIA